jgi:mRNA-degrading endonuclease toxin of MazEF toxin-antitoxin module
LSVLVPIRRGGLYWVPDSAVNFPPLAPKERAPHPRRPFLVISNDERNVEESWPVALGFPITTAHEFKTEYDIEIPKNTGGLGEDSVIRVVMLQPIAKTKLTERIGQLPAETVEACVARMFEYTGAL